jgi:hypothetical protein
MEAHGEPVAELVDDDAHTLPLVVVFWNGSTRPASKASVKRDG